MIIARCPHCSEEVSAPADFSQDAKVRCPLCAEEYPLRDALKSLPPALELVEAGGDSASGEGAARDSGLAVDGEFDFSEQPAASAPARESSSRRSRPKGRERSPLWEVGKVIGGGVIGILLGVLVLWWGLGKDPFRLAPRLPASVKWMAPAKLRGDLPDETEKGGNVGSFPLTSGFEEGQPRRPTTASGGTSERRTPRVLTRLPDTGGTPDGAPPAAEPEKKASPAIRLRNAPAYSSDEFAAAIRAATEAVRSWEQAQGGEIEQRRDALRTLYKSLALLGQRITFVSPTDSRNHELAQRTRQVINKLPAAALQGLGAAGESWLRSAQRPSDGVILVGKVTRVGKAGNLFETVVELPGPTQRIVTVLSGNDPREIYQSDSYVVILGSIVNNPSERIGGYEGLASMAVMGGFPVEIPPQAMKASGRAAAIAKAPSPPKKTPKPNAPEPGAVAKSPAKKTDATPAESKAGSDKAGKKPAAAKPKDDLPDAPDPPSLKPKKKADDKPDAESAPKPDSQPDSKSSAGDAD